MLNAAIRDDRGRDASAVATDRGELIGLGDRVATRHNDPSVGVTNRQTWTVIGMGDDGSLIVHSPDQGRDGTPLAYVREHVELAYATTIHGAQGETVDHAHVAIGEPTGAAAVYVAMTRGRQTNVAHLVAESIDDARKQWVDAFSRDRADLGPAHARGQAIDAIDRYGPAVPRPPAPVPARNTARRLHSRPESVSDKPRATNDFGNAVDLRKRNVPPDVPPPCYRIPVTPDVHAGRRQSTTRKPTSRTSAGYL